MVYQDMLVFYIYASQIEDGFLFDLWIHLQSQQL